MQNLHIKDTIRRFHQFDASKSRFGERVTAEVWAEHVTLNRRRRNPPVEPVTRTVSLHSVQCTATQDTTLLCERLCDALRTHPDILSGDSHERKERVEGRGGPETVWCSSGVVKGWGDNWDPQADSHRARVGSGGENIYKLILNSLHLFCQTRVESFHGSLSFFSAPQVPLGSLITDQWSVWPFWPLLDSFSSAVVFSNHVYSNSRNGATPSFFHKCATPFP